jgi:hypothetical protein
VSEEQGIPWRVFHSPGENYFEVQDNEGLEVAVFYYGVLGAPWDEPDSADRARADQRATFIARAANARGPLVEALSTFLPRGHTEHCERERQRGADCTPRCVSARATLALARGEAQL